MVRGTYLFDRASKNTWGNKTVPTQQSRTALRKTTWACTFACIVMAPAAQSATPISAPFLVCEGSACAGVPQVARGTNGRFVVAWIVQPNGPYGTGDTIVARLFESDASPAGPVFQVSPAGDPSVSTLPSVAMSASGSFVIAWATPVAQYVTTVMNHYAQRFDPDGRPLGPVIEVAKNVRTDYAPDLNRPIVAIDSTGDFVVAWQDFIVNRIFQTGYFALEFARSTVSARRFTVDGAALGDAFSVDEERPVFGENPPQSSPAIGMDSDGDFVVAWTADNSDIGAIRARRFDRNGKPQGLSFNVTPRLNALNPRGFSRDPAVTVDPNGNFVVAWTYASHKVTNARQTTKLLFRKYLASGISQDPEIEVTGANPSDDLVLPGLAGDAAGNFVLTWSDTTLGKVLGQRFSASGAPLGGGFAVADPNPNSFQLQSSVASDSAGNFVVVWQNLKASGVNSVSTLAGQLFSPQ